MRKLGRWGIVLMVVAGCLWGPFAWVVVIDYPWNSYRLTWVKMWPVLPGLLPGAWLFHPNDAAMLTAAGGVTAGLFAGLTWLGSRQRGMWMPLIAAGVLALVIAVPTSWLAYSAFRN